MNTAEIREHMKVVGFDREPVGTVERIVGDRIKLAKTDPQAGGVPHYIATSWVERVEGGQLRLRQSARYATFQWMDS